jgi:cysteinyl-tRNA synthetase
MKIVIQVITHVKIALLSGILGCPNTPEKSELKFTACPTETQANSGISEPDPNFAKPENANAQPCKEYFSQAANLLGDDFKMPGMWQQFWGAHQRFFKYLTMAAKVNKACQIARKAVRENQCVVIGLQSTGEQRTNEEMDRIIAEGEEINEMVSSCKGVFRRLLDTHFPVSDRDKLAELGINFDLPDSPDAANRHSGSFDKKPRYMSLNTTADSNLESDQELASATCL